MAKKTKFGDVHMNSLNMTELCKKNIWLIILKGIQSIQNTFHSSIRPYQDQDYQALSVSRTCVRTVWAAVLLLTCDAALPFTLSVRRFTVWLRLLCTPHDTVLHTICSLRFELILKLNLFFTLETFRTKRSPTLRFGPAAFAILPTPLVSSGIPLRHPDTKDPQGTGSAGNWWKVEHVYGVKKHPKESILSDPPWV